MTHTTENLPRTMGPFSGTMLCVGMIIGSGIFSSPATVLGSVGSVGMTVVIFVIGALVSIFGVLAYLEMVRFSNGRVFDSLGYNATG